LANGTRDAKPMSRAQASDEEVAEAIRQLDESQAAPETGQPVAPSAEDRRREFRRVLEQIDWLRKELRSRRRPLPENETPPAEPEAIPASSISGEDQTARAATVATQPLLVRGPARYSESRPSRSVRRIVGRSVLRWIP
jgi:hypothetical protein